MAFARPTHPSLFGIQSPSEVIAPPYPQISYLIEAHHILTTEIYESRKPLGGADAAATIRSIMTSAVRHQKQEVRTFAVSAM